MYGLSVSDSNKWKSQCIRKHFWNKKQVNPLGNYNVKRKTNGCNEYSLRKYRWYTGWDGPALDPLRRKRIMKINKKHCKKLQFLNTNYLYDKDEIYPDCFEYDQYDEWNDNVSEGYNIYPVPVTIRLHDFNIQIISKKCRKKGNKAKQKKSNILCRYPIDLIRNVVSDATLNVPKDIKIEPVLCDNCMNRSIPELNNMEILCTYSNLDEYNKTADNMSLNINFNDQQSTQKLNILNDPLMRNSTFDDVLVYMCCHLWSKVFIPNDIKQLCLLYFIGSGQRYNYPFVGQLKYLNDINKYYKLRNHKLKLFQFPGMEAKRKIFVVLISKKYILTRNYVDDEEWTKYEFLKNVLPIYRIECKSNNQFTWIFPKYCRRRYPVSNRMIKSAKIGFKKRYIQRKWSAFEKLSYHYDGSMTQRRRDHSRIQHSR